MSNKPIGFFDSGIGGITVLAKAIESLPGERFIYFGDSANAPYGTKNAETVIKLAMEAAEFLLKKEIKALVVACNTATSVAVEHLRNNLDIPVVGMEPALKPAVEAGRGGSVVVMATPLTLKEEKFKSLMDKYASKADIIPLPCPGLVELIEDGIWEGTRLQEYLKERFADINTDDISDIVLGCTHYIFIKKEIDKLFKNKVRLVDGNEGTVRQLSRILNEKGLPDKDMLCQVCGQSLLEFYFSSSKEDILNLCKEWLRAQLSSGI